MQKVLLFRNIKHLMAVSHIKSSEFTIAANSYLSHRTNKKAPHQIQYSLKINKGS